MFNPFDYSSYVSQKYRSFLQSILNEYKVNNPYPNESSFGYDIYLAESLAYEPEVFCCSTFDQEWAFTILKQHILFLIFFKREKNNDVPF